MNKETIRKMVREIMLKNIYNIKVCFSSQENFLKDCKTSHFEDRCSGGGVKPHFSSLTHWFFTIIELGKSYKNVYT